MPRTKESGSYARGFKVEEVLALIAERDALREALEQVAAAFSEDDKAEALERIRLIVTAPGLTPPFAKSKAAAEGNDAETGAVTEDRPE